MGRTIAHLFLFGSSFIWGINFISMKYLTGAIPAFSLLFLRFLIATVFLQCLLFYKNKKNCTIITFHKDDYLKMFATCFIGYLLFYGFQVFSFQFLTANIVALLCALVPIFSLLAETIVYRKRNHPIVYLLSLGSTIGVYLVLDMEWSELMSSGTGWGILLMCLSNICWVIFTIMASDMQKKHGTLASITYQSTVATLLMGLVALGDYQLTVTSLSHHTNIGVVLINLLFIGVFSSGVGYLLYIDGMQRIGIQLASLYMNIIPIITAIASFLLFKERLSISQTLGIAIVILTLFLINYIHQKSQTEKPYSETNLVKSPE